MKVVLYTQRVEYIQSYGERRDCADQNIPHFLKVCGYLPIPVPNIPFIAEKMVQQFSPVGILLTGGNSLVKYGGDAPERDEMEKRLLSIAVKQKIPVYGFCRGMQMILDYFGNKLENVDGHIAVHHDLQGNIIREVNSFHGQGCLEVKKPIEKMAWTKDGVIEAIRVEGLPIFASMWHPERENPFCREDIAQIRELFGNGGEQDESNNFSGRTGD